MVNARMQGRETIKIIIRCESKVVERLDYSISFDPSKYRVRQFVAQNICVML